MVAVARARRWLCAQYSRPNEPLKSKLPRRILASPSLPRAYGRYRRGVDRGTFWVVVLLSLVTSRAKVMFVGGGVRDMDFLTDRDRSNEENLCSIDLSERSIARRSKCVFYAGRSRVIRLGGGHSRATTLDKASGNLSRPGRNRCDRLSDSCPGALFPLRIYFSALGNDTATASARTSHKETRNGT